MSITLAYDGTTLDLTERLLWTDEYDWSPVAIAERWGTTGALMLHVGQRQAGRPITLDGRDSRAWLPRAQCERLKVWEALPGAEFELVVRGQARTVLLLEMTADPIWRLEDGEHTPDLFYVPFFRFLEV